MNVRTTRNKKRKSRQKKLFFYFFISIFIGLIFFISFLQIHKRFTNSQTFSANNLITPKSSLIENNNAITKNNDESSSPKVEEEVKKEEPIKETSDISVLLSFVGDCTIGTDDNFDISLSLPGVLQRHSYDYSYFFKNVSDIFKNDDATIANLETTFTNATQKADKEFNFKAPPEYAKALSLGNIEAVNLSNNHIYDYLNKGFEDTKNSLKIENINYFGEGNKWIKEINGIKFGFLGYSAWSNDSYFLQKIKSDIDELKANNCIVIINFHWGEENKYIPNSIQKSVAHYAIDNGADLIIGHHPHVIQGTEMYKNKMICYSLGNFCFGGNFNPSDKDTFIFQANYKFNDGNLASCGFRVIPCSISSVSTINDYCPTPMTGDIKNQFLSKLNDLSFNLNFQISDEFTYVNN